MDGVFQAEDPRTGDLTLDQSSPPRGSPTPPAASPRRPETDLWGACDDRAPENGGSQLPNQQSKIPYQASSRQARQQKRVFQNWCLDHGYERAAWGQRATAEIGRLLAGFA